MKTKKLLVTFFATVMLTIYSGGTVYAAELDQPDVLTEQEVVTGDTDNTDHSQEDINEGIDNTSNTNMDNIIDDQTDTNSDPSSDETVLGEYTDTVTEEVTEDEVIEDEVIEEETEEADSEEDEEEVEPEDTEEEEDEKKEDDESSYSKKDLRLLVCLIYTEAGNQSYKGMLGVANVVLNRAKSDVYWHVDTIKEVIYDRKWSIQFAVTKKSKSTGTSALDKALKVYDSGKHNESMKRAIKAAKAALKGDNNVGNYLCFQNKRSAGSIKKKYSDYQIIGDHIFYRTK